MGAEPVSDLDLLYAAYRKAAGLLLHERGELAKAGQIVRNAVFAEDKIAERFRDAQTAEMAAWEALAEVRAKSNPKRQ